ncbi:MAG TPA: hypothetical protein VFA04_09875 [Bryobacteraceae bacterium]|nr:hypothetical protein [Bryobacteraceae bacterium]
MWRTGSTWLWQCFRREPAFHCYYEPLHHDLLSHTHELDRAALLRGMTRHMRHPDLSRPYFEEYPVVQNGGVPYYLKRFAHERYCLSEHDEDPELEQYFYNLCCFAYDQGRVPVFQPNRMLLRSRWFCAHFHALHVFVMRNYADVWRSMRSFENQFFPSIILCTIAQNQRHPLFRRLTARFPLPCHRDESVLTEYEYYLREMLRDTVRAFACFYYFYVLTSLYNLACADVLVDIDAVSGDAAFRETVQRRFAGLTLPVSLDDCRITHSSTQIPEDSEDLRGEMERIAVDTLRSEAGLTARGVLKCRAAMGGASYQWVRRLTELM